MNASGCSKTEGATLDRCHPCGVYDHVRCQPMTRPPKINVMGPSRFNVGSPTPQRLNSQRALLWIPVCSEGDEENTLRRRGWQYGTSGAGLTSVEGQRGRERGSGVCRYPTEVCERSVRQRAARSRPRRSTGYPRLRVSGHGKSRDLGDRSVDREAAIRLPGAAVPCNRVCRPQ
jgi:hypothetical protein